MNRYQFDSGNVRDCLYKVPQKVEKPPLPLTFTDSEL